MSNGKPKGAGAYTVTATWEDAANIGTKNATFTIEKAAITVTPDSGQSKNNVEADPTFTYRWTATQNGETAAFDGVLARNMGETVGSYEITQGSLALKDGTGFRAADYTLSFTSGVMFTIIAYNPTEVTTLYGTQGLDGWYTSDVTINAPDGFTINAEVGASWGASFVYSTKGNTNATYYLKNTTTNAVSEAKTIAVKLDKTAPTGTVTVSTNFWDTFLSVITFGSYTPTQHAVTISGNDAHSGIGTLQYVIVDKAYADESALIAANPVWQTYRNSSKPRITANGKSIVYVKDTDNAGNVFYLNSNGIIHDDIKPAIC